MRASILITGHVSSLNKGDESILRVTIDIVKKSLGYKTDVYVLTESPPFKEELYSSVHFIKNPFVAKFSSFTDLNAHVKASRSFLNSDAVIVRGGDCLSNAYGQLSLLTHSSSILPALLLNKPIGFIGHTIGPFTSGNALSSIGISLLRKELLKSDLTIVRDNESVQVLEQMGIDKSSVLVAPDLAFLLSSSPLSQVNEYLSNLMQEHVSDKILGINTSALIYRYGFAGARSKSEKLLFYVDFFAKFLDHVLDKREISVLFIPHVLLRDNDDRDIASLVQRRMKHRDRTYLIHDDLPPEMLKGIIGRVDMLITTRMHPLVHAISMCTPAIAIEYTHKTLGLMSQLGLSDYVLEIKTLTLEKLIRKFDEIWPRLDDLGLELRKQSEKVGLQAAEAARLVHDWLCSHEKS